MKSPKNESFSLQDNNSLPSVILMTHSLLKSYNTRELTFLGSTLSVITLMLLGSCIWCFAHFCKRCKKGKGTKANGHCDGIGSGGISSGESDNSSPEPFFQGWKTENNGGPSTKAMHNSNGKAKNNKLQFCKNIITPDKNIEFVIPTVQMPAQPSERERESFTSLEPGCSKTLSLSQVSIPKQFYPQLAENGEELPPTIGFSLYYEASTQILFVRLIGGQNFPPDVRHCISVQLYPSRGGKQRTKEYEEIGPTYNQEFSFHVRQSSLCTRILRFKGIIPGTPKKVLGCLNLALKDLPGFGSENSPTEKSNETLQDLQSGQLWKCLEQPSDMAEGIRLRVSVQWQDEPQPGLLTLKIIEASGLHETTTNDYTSSHVRVTLQEQGRNIKSRKTKLVRWGSVPVYDDVFVVTIPCDLLGQISFLMEVIARGRLGSKVALGKISIGTIPFVGPSTDGMEFWEDMCHQKNTEIVRWLQLVS